MVAYLHATEERTFTMLNLSHLSAFRQQMCFSLSNILTIEGQQVVCLGFFLTASHASRISKIFSRLRNAGNYSHHCLECGFSLSEYSNASQKLIWPSQNLLNLQNWAEDFMRTGCLTRFSEFPLLTENTVRSAWKPE